MKKLFFSILLSLISIILTSCTKLIETNGTIIDTTYNPLIGGEWSEKAWYEFYVDEQRYFDTVYIEQGEIGFVKGQQIKVIYKENNPKDNNLNLP